MLKVGLTGSIAVGKSYVVSVLAELGCVTFDADKVAHSVMEPVDLLTKISYASLGTECWLPTPRLIGGS
jgi:dephospho-CoA kinase